MAATTTTITTSHLEIVQNQPIKSRRRRCSKETTISSSAAANGGEIGNLCPGHPTRKLDPPTIVSPDNSWCCPASRPISNPPPPTHSRRVPVKSDPDSALSDSNSISSSSFRIRFSPGNLSPVMDFALTNGNSNSNSNSQSNFTKFNSALTAGLLNPMSPPPPGPDKTRSSPTLFEMMTHESDTQLKNQTQIHLPISAPKSLPPSIDKQALLMQKISDLLSSRSPGNQFNDPNSSDMKLTLSSQNGIAVSMSVHKQILVAQSRFFAAKLSERLRPGLGPYTVEISDCDDVEVYIETLRLMYCKDMRKMLMKEDVSKVLGILKVSAAIGFDAGVLSCLEYLEAAPWDDDEEEKVASLLSELNLENVGAGEVLKRVSIEVPSEERNDNEKILVKLLHMVLEGKDEKARREMKGLVFKMLHENSSQNDIRKDSLYSACDVCLENLRQRLVKAAASDLQDVGQIARQADNLHWILDILIDRQIAEDFLKTWASQTELSSAHSKVPAVHRYEVSRVTARLLVAIGKGELLASKDTRSLLLHTWLVPFYDDFVWMKRAYKGLDRNLIENCLSNTILTLPLALQQEIFISWFDRFLNSGDGCPNLQRGFEVWWKRAFSRRGGEQQQPRPLPIAAATIEN